VVNVGGVEYKVPLAEYGFIQSCLYSGNTINFSNGKAMMGMNPSNC